MATSYPGAVDALTNPIATDAMNSVTVPHASQHTNANDAIEAIETELGTDPSGASATVKTRLDTLDATVAGKAPATGIAPSAITGTAVVTADARLADARTPTAHAASHASSGSDPVTVAQSQVTSLVSDLALKSPLASPALTGVPTAPTAAPGTNTTQIASSAFVTAAVTSLINAAPGALDTLDELAAALGDDANYAATITAALALKAPLASPTFTGTVVLPATSSVGPVSATEIGYLDGLVEPLSTSLAAKAALASPIFSGNVGIGGAPSGLLHLASNSNASQWIEQNSTNANAPTMLFVKRRGTAAAPEIVASGDGIGTIPFYAYDGVAIRQVAAINVNVDGTPGASDMPSRLAFYTTPDGSLSLTERVRIDNAGSITGTGASLGAWTATVPTIGGTGWALGNGGAAGAWVKIGKMVHFEFYVTWGTTSTFGASSGLTLSLPVAPLGSNETFAGRATDVSTGIVYQLTAWKGAGNVIAVNTTTLAGGGQQQAVGNQPFVWASGDSLVISGTYEAA